MSDSRPDYWHIQIPNKPLFEDLIWSQPENKSHAGKLLIIGGNIHGFNSPAKAYEYATKAGIGSARVCLPNVLQRTLGSLFPDADFAPSTPSGSFGRSALAGILDGAAWADMIMLAGDFGKNSETAVMLETLLEKYKGSVSITQDSIDYFINNQKSILSRPSTLIISTMSQLQKLTTQSHLKTIPKHSLSLMQFVESMHELTTISPASFVIEHSSNLVVASKGEVSSTIYKDSEAWQVGTSAFASVWLLQNPGNPFQAITTGVSQFIKV